MASLFLDPDEPAKENCTSEHFVQPGTVDTTLQLGISLVLGLSAFITFCVSSRLLSPSYVSRMDSF